MNKRLLYILIPAIALAFGAAFFIERRELPPTAVRDAAVASSAAPAETISLSVGSETYEAVSGVTTVANFMSDTASRSSLTYRTKEFPGLGAFVDEINGVRSANGYYWILLINGKKSDFGISETIVRPGDRIEWRYEEGY